MYLFKFDGDVKNCYCTSQGHDLDLHGRGHKIWQRGSGLALRIRSLHTMSSLGQGLALRTRSLHTMLQRNGYPTAVVVTLLEWTVAV